MTLRKHITLGSNIGDRMKYLSDALSLLSETSP